MDGRQFWPGVGLARKKIKNPGGVGRPAASKISRRYAQLFGPPQFPWVARCSLERGQAGLDNSDAFVAFGLPATLRAGALASGLGQGMVWVARRVIPTGTAMVGDDVPTRPPRSGLASGRPLIASDRAAYRFKKPRAFISRMRLWPL